MLSFLHRELCSAVLIPNSIGSQPSRFDRRKYVSMCVSSTVVPPVVTLSSVDKLDLKVWGWSHGPIGQITTQKLRIMCAGNFKIPGGALPLVHCPQEKAPLVMRTDNVTRTIFLIFRQCDRNLCIVGRPPYWITLNVAKQLICFGWYIT